MSTNRISGTNPSEPNRNQETKTQREEKQRVEKVREVDPDEQAKQRRQFRAMMDDTSKTETSGPRTPSPFETKFYQSEADPKSLPDVDSAAVSSPSASPPPDVTIQAQPSGSDDADLPQSDVFWSDVDLPDQPIQQPTFQSQTQKSSDTDSTVAPTGAKGKKGGTVVPPGRTEAGGKKGAGSFSAPAGKDKKGVEPSPFGPPGKKKEEDVTPSGRYWSPDAELQTGAPSKGKSKEPSSREEMGASPLKPELDEKGQPPISSQAFRDTLNGPVSKEKEKEGQGKKGSQKHNVEIVAPSTPSLPTDIQPYAMAAATQAAPYLSPEVLPLFYQMVGSVLIMTNPPGISRTQILLNAPAFANSKFFGSTIEIIKYSTAPDSLNIRLTGSNEAVSTFKENIPSLMAAFQSGRFNFRIGRLEASFSADRPLFRRKGGARGDNDSDSKGDQP